MQQKIPDEIIDQIVSQHDIVDVVGNHVKLTKKGRNYFGLCPFHGEDTPSFSVAPDKQIFHCFGCGKGGNAVKFIMEYESISFVAAVKKLADEQGIEIPSEYVKTAESNLTHADQQSIEANQWASKLFHHVLKNTSDGSNAIEYLSNRGFDSSVIETFQLGYSPPKDQFLTTFLEKKGFVLQELADVGLISTRNGNSFFDRFKGRIMFPIHNHQGKIVGFGGRGIDSETEPKYLNSPESKLFQKGKLLYNFHQSRKHAQKLNEIVLLEGYADVIKVHQAGVYHTVATLGTSLSSYQANLLKRYVDRVKICFDGDQAGQNASYKTAQLLHKMGLNVLVATIPDNLDPDDYIDQFGSEKFKNKVIDQAQTYTAFMLQYEKKQYNLQVDHERLTYIERALDLISEVDQGVERDFYLRELAESFELYRETLEKEIDERRRIKRPQYENAKRVTNNQNSGKQSNDKGKIYLAYQNAERYLLAHMLQDQFLSDTVQKRIGSKFNMQQHQVLVTYLYAYYEEGNEPNVSKLMERLPDDELKNLVAELSLISINDSLDQDELEDYLFAISKESNIDNEIRELERMMKQAEKEKDPKSAARIGMKILELRKKSNKSKLR
ncbi:DNA primase [Halalkalibacillus halophilus]|uniref:DNA primase n=1 Tax=Halalkalibacillus halophilus TaxID=392827 RepID=UPI000428C9A7|nr:DNA primase [Halalkalibacillus halophilus]